MQLTLTLTLNPKLTPKPNPLQILELLEHKAIFTAGYKCILHVHSVVEECECVKLIAVMDPKTKEKKKVGRKETPRSSSTPAAATVHLTCRRLPCIRQLLHMLEAERLSVSARCVTQHRRGFIKTALRWV